jgi:hypothetical protein
MGMGEGKRMGASGWQEEEEELILLGICFIVHQHHTTVLPLIRDKIGQ